MNAVDLRTALRQTENLAFILVVVAAYASTFVLSSRPFSPSELALLLGLGFVFTLIGLLDVDFFRKISHGSAPLIYFTIQLPIAGSILYLSQGNAWLMLLPLSAQTVTCLSRRGVMMVNALILGIVYFNLRLLTDDWGRITQALVAFLAAILFVVAFTQVAMNERKARAEAQRLADELGMANQKLRAYAIQAEELAAAQERNRLAREIHDGLGHYLTTINILIKAALALLRQDLLRTEQSMARAQTLTQDALAEVRRSVAALRGENYLARPLSDTLEHLLQECRASGMVAEISIQGAERPLSPETELTLYRTAQESLTNVRKHSLASRVDLTLEYCPVSTRLTIQDNGVGSVSTRIDSGDEQGGFGLFGLRERVRLLGGRLDIHTDPGQGFTIQVEIPERINESDSHTDRRRSGLVS